MNRFLTIVIVAIAATSFVPGALGEQANPLLGTWTVVAVDDVRPDGSKHPLMGPDPQGMLVFDAGGLYSLQLCAADRPKFAANDRSKGTADENRAAVLGCNPHWGRYVVNEADKTILFKIDHAFYRNWEGTEQKRAFTLAGNELRYSIPNPSESGANPVVVWKRAR
jgi:hypothetical protein